MPVQKHFLHPQDFGLDSVGHMRYFSRKTYQQAPELWQMAVDWFNDH